AAVSRGGAAGFTATFEIAAADEAGGCSGKKETQSRPGIHCPTLGRPINPRYPYLPKGGEGAGDDALALATLATRSTLAIPYLPEGRRGRSDAARRERHTSTARGIGGSRGAAPVLLLRDGQLVHREECSQGWTSSRPTVAAIVKAG